MQTAVAQKNNKNPQIVSLFAGCGGLDLGFEYAGFDVVWANEYDKDIWATYEFNHKKTELDRRSITDIHAYDIPECDGIIGGPPCQSWSEGGAKRGLEDKRGQLFFDYIRILKAKKPLFFLAENVSGMLLDRHSIALESFKQMFQEAGYSLSFQMVNAADYGVPQDRKRIFFVGFRSDLGVRYRFPEPSTVKEKITLQQAIGDIKEQPIGVSNGVNEDAFATRIPNHQYMTGGFSSIYMSRNRVRSWDEVSFTIQAQARQAPMHPQAPKMEMLDANKRGLVKGKEDLYRRLSVRECARIQTFPDDFIFKYKNIAHGYKMIGNAVPVNLAKVIASSILEQLKQAISRQKKES